MSRSDPRAVVLAAARPLFARYGFKKTSVDEILRAAGVSRATLYSYFAGKEEIFNEVVREEAAKLQRSVEEAVAAEATYSLKLRAYFQSLFGSLTECANLHNLSADVVTEIVPLAHGATVDVRDALLARLTQLLRDGVAAGELYVDRPEMVAEGLDAVIVSLQRLFLSRRDTPAMYAGIYDLFELTLRGMRTRGDDDCSTPREEKR